MNVPTSLSLEGSFLKTSLDCLGYSGYNSALDLKAMSLIPFTLSHKFQDVSIKAVVSRDRVSL